MDNIDRQGKIYSVYSPFLTVIFHPEEAACDPQLHENKQKTPFISDALIDVRAVRASVCDASGLTALSAVVIG